MSDTDFEALNLQQKAEILSLTAQSRIIRKKVAEAVDGHGTLASIPAVAEVLSVMVAAVSSVKEAKNDVQFFDFMLEHTIELLRSQAKEIFAKMREGTLN